MNYQLPASSSFNASKETEPEPLYLVLALGAHRMHLPTQPPEVTSATSHPLLRARISSPRGGMCKPHRHPSGCQEFRSYLLSAGAQKAGPQMAQSSQELRRAAEALSRPRRQRCPNICSPAGLSRQPGHRAAGTAPEHRRNTEPEPNPLLTSSFSAFCRLQRNTCS